MIAGENIAGLGLAVIALSATAGGAAQQQLAQLSHALGRRYALLAVAAISAIASAALHGWVGQLLTHFLPDEWRATATAMVLILAAVRLMFASSVQQPAEPTYSLGAMTLVLFARQIAAPPGLVISAAVIGGMALFPAIIAGAAGSILAFAVAWRIPAMQAANSILSILRVACAALIVGCAIYIIYFV